MDHTTSADRPQPGSPADSLRDWLARVNRASSASVACHPGPDRLRWQDCGFYYRPGSSPSAMTTRVLAAVVGAVAELARLTVRDGCEARKPKLSGVSVYPVASRSRTWSTSDRTR